MTFEEGISTLTVKFLEMLNLAEELFGKKNEDWTFIGIEFRQGGPYIRYYSKNKVSIVLSSDCSRTFPQSPKLYFQLSHETCHILYPTGKNDANILNEGISTYFSKIFVEKEYPKSKYAINAIEESIYYEAFLLVEKLLDLDQDAIKKIRSLNRDISNISIEELKSLGFNLPNKDLMRLTEKFG